MLTLKTLEWSNCFSYGNNNVIHFNKEPLIQLTGDNGSGKTSISLILQEILYGKNNRNIKKQDIVNNKSGVSGYSISLFFTKNEDEYSIHLDRKSNLKLKLYKNSKDISSHTSLNTYKTISSIIGITDFKVFCQLVYQHSTDSLEFLTATDTNRKKFLISLLQLDKYLEFHEIFKDKVRTTSSDITRINGGISAVESWIDKHKDTDFNKKSLLNVSAVPEEWRDKLGKLQNNINNINSINKKIATNNEYKKQLSLLDEKYYLGTPPTKPEIEVQELHSQIRVLNNSHDLIQNKINKLNKLRGTCPQCLQKIDEKLNEEIISKEIIERDSIKEKADNLFNLVANSKSLENEINKYKTEKIEFEKLTQLIDSNLDSKTLDLQELLTEIQNLKLKIKNTETEHNEATYKNLKIAEHNSKIDVIKEQLESMKKDLHIKNVELVEKENLNSILELLKKTFSTNGLVSYKIESSIKELEKKINEYLAELSEFQMYFKLSGEKLNLEIFDGKNNQTAIQNLSSGERARLNLASILAIRNILSSLTNTKINLLFLDEITGSLDAEGKEKFSEILLKEDLNTFFVSHEWTHPLIPRINIVKENNISRIEDD